MTVAELIKKLEAYPQHSTVGFYVEDEGEEFWTNPTNVRIEGRTPGFELVVIE